jgi:hypothetical protein
MKMGLIMPLKRKPEGGRVDRPRPKQKMGLVQYS